MLSIEKSAALRSRLRWALPPSTLGETHRSTGAAPGRKRGLPEFDVSPIPLSSGRGSLGPGASERRGNTKSASLRSRLVGGNGTALTQGGSAMGVQRAGSRTRQIVPLMEEAHVLAD